MVGKLTALIYGEEALEKNSLKTLSLALLAVAMACAWWPHSQSFFWLWKRSVSFTPDFISGMMALAVIAPLYVRRIIPYRHHSVNGILFLSVNWTLTATFVQIGLKGAGLGTFPALAVIICAIVLSWLGMRAAALLAWLVLLIYSVFSMMFTDIGWGFSGFCFVVCGFSGILLQTPLHPGEMISELTSEYSRRKPAQAPRPPRVVIDPALGRADQSPAIAPAGGSIWERMPDEQ